MRIFRQLVLWIAVTFALALPVAAQTSEDREFRAALAEARAKGISGPARVPLGTVATMDLPRDYLFVPTEPAKLLMNAMGNSYRNAGNFGIIIPVHTYTGWFFAVAEHRIGHVTPETVKSWQDREILIELRDATRRGNHERAKLGASRIDIADFIEPPKYDAARHRLTVAARVIEVGPSSGDEDSANLDAHLFGRHGTIEVALVAGVHRYPLYRAALDQLVAATNFNPGHRYADVDATVDKAAEQPLMLLFGGHTLEDLAAQAAAEKADKVRMMTARSSRGSELPLIPIILGLIALGAMAAAFLVFGGDKEPKSRLPRHRDDEQS